MDERIRHGGLQTPQGFLFELTGGDVSLDLVNTVDNRPTDYTRDLIPKAADLISWARQVGLLTRKQEAQLCKEAARKPAAAEKARRRAVQLRECLFRLFVSIVEGKDTPAEVVAEWNRFLHQAMDHYESVRTEDGMAWRLRADREGFDRILWPIVHAAMQLLTGPQAMKLRRCAGENCDWLFIDTSKRGNRRWCDMTVCGNRAKARRFYRRKKAGESAS